MGARRKIDVTRLTTKEVREYDRRVQLRTLVAAMTDTAPLPAEQQARLRTVKLRYIFGGAGATALAAILAGTVLFDATSSDEPGLVAMVVGIFTGFMAFVVGLIG